MKRFFGKIGRFFGSRGFLKFVLWTVTLVVLFYAEEDWRGAHAWAATKAKWEARGVNLDLAKLTPPSVPESQNLGAIPLFQLTRVDGYGGPSYFDDVTLRKAMEKGWSTTDAPQVNGWIWGDLPDLDKIRESISTQYAKTFKQRPSSNDTLVQLDDLYPFLSILRDASALRPYCRFAYDNTQALPAGRVLGLVVGQLALSKLLTLHGILVLNENQSDVALADFETASKLGAGAGDDPSLFGALVSIGVSAISTGIIYDGLARHAWSDEQLAEIDRVLQSMDFLATYRFAMQSEASATVSNLDYIYKNDRPDFLSILLGMSLYSAKSSSPLMDLPYLLFPAGWMDENKAQVADKTLREVASIDDDKQLAYPEIDKSLQAESRKEGRWGLAPWNVFASILDLSKLQEPAKFAYAQTRVNETRIACALERYWLMHHAYPASLDALVPDDIAALPHDVMTGKPYLYRLRPEGTFLLYSVGWDQTDDGGRPYSSATPLTRRAILLSTSSTATGSGRLRSSCY
jgi:hypothetical protein